MKKNTVEKKQATGITLISLVITIIVLLILAGITINLTIGNTGIINMAKKAGEENRKAEIISNIQLELVEAEAEAIQNGNGSVLESTVRDIVGKYGSLRRRWRYNYNRRRL